MYIYICVGAWNNNSNNTGSSIRSHIPTHTHILYYTIIYAYITSHHGPLNQVKKDYIEGLHDTLDLVPIAAWCVFGIGWKVD